MRVLHNLLKKSITVLMVATLVVTCIFSGTGDAWAAVGDTGRVTYSEGLNVRSGAGTGYSILGALAYGEEFVIKGETKDTSGVLWYQLNFNGATGYVSSAYVEIVDVEADNPTPPSDQWEHTKQGVVINASTVNIRSGAGTSYGVVGSARFGDTYVVSGETNGWYRIRYNNQTAYISGTYMEILEKGYVYDSDFESYMIQQGFPESYKPYLRTLHANYPKWKFTAYNTGLSWNTVISKENQKGINLVHYSMPESWKAGNVSQDTGGYVSASKAAIEYCLDPRNLLNVADVFQFLDHRYDGDVQTSSGLQNVLNGTFMAGSFPESSYNTYKGLLMDVGEESGVNPYVLASMIIVEQGSDGSGGCISGKVSGYEGYYNHFNVNAYATSSRTAVQNGLAYAAKTDASEYRPWNSRYKSIRGGAAIYGKNYVNSKQNSLYFKKFNVMNGSNRVGVHQYMTNLLGAENEAIYLRRGYSNVLDSTITFAIPIYSNLPANAIPEPGTTIEEIGDSIHVTAGNRAEDGNVILSWEAVENADVYEVYRSTTKTGGYQLLHTATTTTYLDESSIAGMDYYYKVKALSLDSGSSIVSAAILRTGDCAQPKVEVKIDEVSGKPRISWEKVDGAGKYEIWRTTEAAEEYTKIYTTDGTSLLNMSTEPGVTYYYQVKALSQVTKYADSAFSTVDYITCDCAQPKMQIKIDEASGKPRISWEKVDGAGSYEIWRKTGVAGTFSKIYTTEGTSLLNMSTEPGVTYYYKVKALSKTTKYADSAFSKVDYITCDCAQPEMKITVDAVSGNPRISWKKVEGAGSYEIWRKTGATGTFSRIYTSTGTSLLNTSTEPGVTYYYKVKALSKTTKYADSAFSKVDYITCDCAQPEMKITVDAVSGKPRISWKKVEGAGSYEIWRKTGATGTFSRIYTSTGTSLLNTSTEPGVTYYYKVKALSKTTKYADSAFSKVDYITCDCPRPKVQVAIDAVSGKPRISWEKVEGAGRYEIWRKAGATGTFSRIYTSTGNSLLNMSAKPGVTYYYKVKALNKITEYGNSDFSITVSAKSK